MGEAVWRGAKQEGKVQDGAEAAALCKPLPKGGDGRMPL